MTRLLSIILPLLIALIFTECRDDCDDGASCCGLVIQEPVGVQNFTTTFQENDFQENEFSLPTILLTPNYKYAIQKKHSFFTSAIACSFVVEYNLDPFIDSIKAKSIPVYNSIDLTSQLEYENSRDNKFTLNDYNSYVDRDLETVDIPIFQLNLNTFPTESDSFTFSFYYYKDGEIIDSSSTQNFYINGN